MHKYTCTYVCTYALVHKRMSILTFEGLPTTFKASMNAYFCHISNKHILNQRNITIAIRHSCNCIVQIKPRNINLPL